MFTLTPRKMMIKERSTIESVPIKQRVRQVPMAEEVDNLVTKMKEQGFRVTSNSK